MTLAMEELAWSATEMPAPRHIAIIMDGNGRWAAERGLPRAEGHRQGVESVRRTVKAALELGITHLTLFSFSSENWSRPRQEIHDLFGLMRRFIRRDLADLHKNGVKIRVIGTRVGLDDDILRLIDDAVLLTKDNSALNSPSPSTTAPATRSPAPLAASPRRWHAARSPPTTSRRSASAPISTPPTCPIPTCSSARAASCA